MRVQIIFVILPFDAYTGSAFRSTEVTTRFLASVFSPDVKYLILSPFALFSTCSPMEPEPVCVLRTRNCVPGFIALPLRKSRLPLLARRTALTIEFCADVACLITSVKSAFGVFNASSIAVTAAFTLATAASVFGRPIDLARYSPIVAEILDRRLRSSCAFLLLSADTVVATAAVVVVSTKLEVVDVIWLKRVSTACRDARLSVITFERGASAVAFAASSLRTDVSLFETVSDVAGFASSEVTPACD